jgi:outer membrane immunogenic protein
LQDGWKYANIHADLGVIRGIPASSGTATVTCLVPSHAMTRITPTLAAFALAALAALVEPATAADPLLPLRPAPPAMSWYGSFIGIQAGYAWGSEAVEFTNATGALAGTLGVTIPRALAQNPAGFVGGAQWGSNWQSDRFVYGFFSDFSYSDIRASETLALGGGALGTRSNFAEQRLMWFGTSRLRGGYLVSDNLLLYGSGGLASGTTEVTVSNNAAGLPCSFAGACPFGSDSKTRYGWALGLGAEYAYGPWSITLDYIHYDLGRLNLTYGDGVSTSFATTSTRFSGDMLRGGINYRFNWTFWDLLTGRARL